MTLIADDGAATEALSESERRAPSREPRRSWASPQPFEPRVTLGVGQDDSWQQVRRGYLRSTIVVDFVITAVLTGALLYGYGWVAALWAVAGGLAFVGLVAIAKGYRRESLGSSTTEFQATLNAGLALAGILVFYEFSFHQDLPRRLVFVGIPVLVALTWIDRHRRRSSLHGRRRAGTGMQRTVVIGEAPSAAMVVKQLQMVAHHGFEPVGVCLPDASERDLVGGVPVLGSIADVVQIVADQNLDVVVVSGSALSGEAMRRLSWALGRVKAELIVAPDLVDVAGPRLRVRPTAGLSLLEVEVDPPMRRLLAKSMLDRVVGVGALMLAAPVIAVFALAVRLTSPGGAFFKQTRVGLDGSTFTMWKLRSMYIDAEERRAALLASSDGNGVLFKMHDDPRVTRVGRIIRRFSIDELPQLWNVVRGEMSLVGPRPPLLAEVAEYPDHVGRRLHVRPGLTGLWQVSGRSDLDWDTAVTLDLRYVDNWSMTMDLMILWKTTRAVLRGSGAY